MYIEIITPVHPKKGNVQKSEVFFEKNKKFH